MIADRYGSDVTPEVHESLTHDVLRLAGQTLRGEARQGAATEKVPAAAEPITRRLLACYANWLHRERQLVCMEMFPHLGSAAEDFVLHSRGANDFHFPADLP